MRQRTVFKPHARGTLNLDGQGIGSAAQPADLDAARRARHLRSHLGRNRAGVRRPASHGTHARYWKWSAGGDPGGDQVPGAAEQRYRKLPGRTEAVGAQGIPLTAGRSIAVDKALHAYGTPFFIEADLPLTGPSSRSPFRRLMIAQ